MLVSNGLGCLCAVIATISLMSGEINTTVVFACLGLGCGIGTLYERFIP
jgi:hypothetical protein